MRLQIKGRNAELTPDVRTYVESKFTRLGRQLADETAVEVELVEETKHGQFTAEATVFAKGQTLRARRVDERSPSFDRRLVETMERQIVGYREKRRLERRRRTEHHRV